MYSVRSFPRPVWAAVKIMSTGVDRLPHSDYRFRTVHTRGYSNVCIVGHNQPIRYVATWANE